MTFNTEFYVKIPQNFFELPSMINLRDKAGQEGQDIYLKLMLWTASSGGVLGETRDDGTVIPYSARMICHLIPRYDEEAIQKTLDALVEEGLATLDENGVYALTGMEEEGRYVIKDNAEARRKRIQRAKKKAEAAQLLAEAEKAEPEMETTAEEMSADSQDEEEVGDDVAMEPCRDDVGQTREETAEDVNAQCEDPADTLRERITSRTSTKNLLVTVTDLGDLDLKAVL